jgi:hypothetical protein
MVKLRDAHWDKRGMKGVGVSLGSWKSFKKLVNENEEKTQKGQTPGQYMRSLLKSVYQFKRL